MGISEGGDGVERLSPEYYAELRRLDGQRQQEMMDGVRDLFRNHTCVPCTCGAIACQKDKIRDLGNALLKLDGQPVPASPPMDNPTNPALLPLYQWLATLTALHEGATAGPWYRGGPNPNQPISLAVFEGEEPEDYDQFREIADNFDRVEDADLCMRTRNLLPPLLTYLTATLARIEADLLSEGEYGRAQLRLLGWGPSDAARKLTAHDAALSSLSLLTAMMEQSRLAVAG